MNAKHITYWIATLFVCAFMAYVSYAYLSHEPKMMSAFASLGYPSYFPMILGMAKILGIIALLVPGLPHLKEWAYAGFTFTFVGAIFSHLESHQAQAVVMPLASLVVLAISYATRPEERRPVMESAAEHHHHFDGGVPIR
jgi:p-aminobenzoyl-glutamate transporter AbgT